MDEPRKKIDHKYVLLDTGVVIRAFEHFDYFEGFFKFLQSVTCLPVYFPFIEFEFTRGANQKEHKKVRQQFLKKIAQINLPTPNLEIVESAISIANAYAARKVHSPSLVDCCIAAYLKRHSSNLFFVTLNNIEQQGFPNLFV